MFKRVKGLEALLAEWELQWESALAVWSRFTQLQAPHWCLTRAEEKKERLSGSFAMIRLQDHIVVISLRLVKENKLQQFSREIMAHEIGHHVYAPADLIDNARLMARIRAGLPSKEHLAGLVSNLYTDLLINDRLQRSAGLNMAGVYQAMAVKTDDPLWLLYMRIYELLWRLPENTLAKGKIVSSIAGDAQLGARLIRVYSRDWIEGAGRFAALCLPYLLKDNGKKIRAILVPLLDADQAGEGEEIPDGLAEIDPAEEEGAIHPSRDPVLSGLDEEAAEKKGRKKQSGPKAGGREIYGGQKNPYRTPDEYAELMKSLGVKVSKQDMIIRYYRERALPQLIPFPARKIPKASDPLPEGEELWDIGSPPGEIDWIGSVSSSPYVIPGVTTVKRVYGTTPGFDPKREPVDLYLGIDCSGSMPNPQYQMSYPVLAGAIMALSALRAGARVMVVLSGEPGEFSTTGDFTRDEHKILKILTGYLGTGYAFGIELLNDTFLRTDLFFKKTHILIITDSDIFSMLQSTPKGWEIARKALDIAGGGGTYVLHHVSPNYPEVERMRKDNWDVYGLKEWDSLIDFARAFSRKKYDRN